MSKLREFLNNNKEEGEKFTQERKTRMTAKQRNWPIYLFLLVMGCGTAAIILL